MTLVLPSGAARAAVYSRLLEALPEEAIFTITGTLVNDILGSALGAHPFPMIVRDFHRVIGDEARRQILEKEGRLP